jgi:hypothetical protein
MALIDGLALMRSAEFTGRTKVAVVKAALSVLAEDSGTANHAERAAFAARVLQQPDHYTDVLLAGVVTNATVASSGEETTDNDLEFTVSSIWDAYATAFAPIDNVG